MVAHCIERKGLLCCESSPSLALVPSRLSGSPEWHHPPWLSPTLSAPRLTDLLVYCRDGKGRLAVRARRACGLLVARRVRSVSRRPCCVTLPPRPTVPALSLSLSLSLNLCCVAGKRIQIGFPRPVLSLSRVRSRRDCQAILITDKGAVASLSRRESVSQAGSQSVSQSIGRRQNDKS